MAKLGATHVAVIVAISAAVNVLMELAKKRLSGCGCQ